MINVRTEVENVTNARAKYAAQLMEMSVRQVYGRVLDLYFENNTPDEIEDQISCYFLTGVKPTLNVLPGPRETKD